MLFGEKLQSLRRQKGMSQEQLAIQLGVSRQAVSKWELNDSIPDTEKIIRLSDLFNVSTDYILKDDITNANECQISVVSKNNKYTNWFGIGCVIFSTISFFVIWVLEKMYPAPIVNFNPETQSWKVGLANFIWVHGLENFMLILAISFIVGIGLIFRKQLKKSYGLIQGKLKRAK